MRLHCQQTCDCVEGAGIPHLLMCILCNIDPMGQPAYVKTGKVWYRLTEQ